MGLMNLFQQATTQSASNDIPATIQGAVALLLLFGAREVPDLAKHAKAYMDIRAQERQKHVDLLETANSQIKTLGERIDKLYERLDETDARANRAEDRASKAEEKTILFATEAETQRQLHEQRVSQVTDEFTRKMEAAVREVAEGKDVVINNQAATIQTLTTQLKEVTDERDQLRIENIGLKEELAKVTPPQMPAVPSAPTPPDQVGNAPLAEDESSSKLPGLTG